MTGRVVGEPDVLDLGAKRLTAAWNGADEALDNLAESGFASDLARQGLEALGLVASVAGDLRALAEALRQADGRDNGVVDVADDEEFAEILEEASQTQVMTFNIGRGKDGDEGAEQDELDEVAAAIAENGPEVVSLQEVHEDDIPILLRILREEYGLVYDADFAAALPAGYVDDDPTRTHPYGIAVLSLAPISSRSQEDLPNPNDHENRVLQEITTTVDGQTVTVLNTHLTTEDDGTQEDQTRALLDRAVAIDGPVVVTGDFNQTPGTLADRADDADVNGRVDVANDKHVPTVGVGDWNPFNNKTIDYVLTSDDIEVEDREVLDDDVSDHRAVVVDIDI